MDNGNAPAKADIAGVKQEIALLRAETHQLHQALIERLADSETKLLKAFHTYTELNLKRLAEIERNRLPAT